MNHYITQSISSYMIHCILYQINMLVLMHLHGIKLGQIQKRTSLNSKFCTCVNLCKNLLHENDPSKTDGRIAWFDMQKL
jgi:hypothetical protein